MHLKAQSLTVIHGPWNNGHWQHKRMQCSEPLHQRDLSQSDPSQMSVYSEGEITSEQISTCPTSPRTACQAGATLQEPTKGSNSQSSIDIQTYFTSSYCSSSTMASLWDAISGGLHLLCRVSGCQGQVSRAGCNLNSGRVQINAVQERRESFRVSWVSYSNNEQRETQSQFVLEYRLGSVFIPSLSCPQTQIKHCEMSNSSFA